jgi:hypothetical protein
VLGVEVVFEFFIGMDNSAELLELILETVGYNRFELNPREQSFQVEFKRRILCLISDWGMTQLKQGVH